MCTNMVIPLLDLDLVHGHTRLMLEETGTQMMVCMQATSKVIQYHRVLIPVGSPGPMLPSM